MNKENRSKAGLFEEDVQWGSVADLYGGTVSKSHHSNVCQI